MKQGFTLIELLVVVLIIGILSSVALPQYTKAVEKARATEAIQLLGDMATAEQIYQMGMGNYTNDLSMLDLQLPGVGTTTTSTTNTKNFKITVIGSGTTFAAKAERARDVSGTFTVYGTGTDLQYAIGLNIDSNGNIFRWCDTSITAGLTSQASTTNKLCKSIANNATGVIK